MPCRVLLDQITEAYTSGDVPALISLYDEDALICGAAEPDTIMGRDELFVRSDVLHRTHLVGPIDVIPIDQTELWLVPRRTAATNLPQSASGF